MVEKTFRIRLVGDLSLRVLAGKADPDAPMPFLYNLRGTNAREGLSDRRGQHLRDHASQRVPGG